MIQRSLAHDGYFWMQVSRQLLGFECLQHPVCCLLEGPELAKSALESGPMWEARLAHFCDGLLHRFMQGNWNVPPAQRHDFSLGTQDCSQLILSQLDHASEEQWRHNREVKAWVVGAVKRSLGRHLWVGLLNELRICLNLDTGAPCMGWWGQTQVHGMGHFAASFAMKMSKNAFLFYLLFFLFPHNHWSGTIWFCTEQLWEMKFIPLGWVGYVPMRFVPHYGQWQKRLQ